MRTLGFSLQICRPSSGIPAPAGYAWLYVVDPSGTYQAVTVTVDGVSYPIYAKV